jgi:hypothetical protein
VVFNEYIDLTDNFTYEVNFSCPDRGEFTAIIMKNAGLYYRNSDEEVLVHEENTWIGDQWDDNYRRPTFHGPTIPFDLAQYLINNSIIGIEGFNTLAITENGQYYVTKYDKVSVNIPEKTPLIPYISPYAATSTYYFEYSSSDGY